MFIYYIWDDSTLGNWDQVNLNWDQVGFFIADNLPGAGFYDEHQHKKRKKRRIRVIAHIDEQEYSEEKFLEEIARINISSVQFIDDMSKIKIIVDV